MTFLGKYVFDQALWYNNLTEEFAIVGDNILIKYNGDGGDVVIPEGVSTIGCGAFAYCGAITSIAIPKSVKSIGEYAFFYCSSLISVVLPNSLTDIGENIFSGCDELVSVTVKKTSDAEYYIEQNYEDITIYFN